LELQSPTKQSVDLIKTKLRVAENITSACLSGRSFYRLRRAILASSVVKRNEIRPQARIRELFPRNRHSAWDSVRIASGFRELPSTGWFSQHRTIADFTKWVVLHAAHRLKRPDEPWSYGEIRYIVRAVVEDVTGTKDFADDADFVRDIGID
jgi:hypothetical protein